MLELVNVNVNYGQTQALKGINLSAKEGSIVALVGPNAAGKTTTLKAITGLKPITSGEIRLRGQRIDQLDTSEIIRQGIALSPEGRRVFPELTVLENLRLGAYLRNERPGDQTGYRAGLWILPRSKNAGETDLGHVERGRAADARHRACPHG